MSQNRTKGRQKTPNTNNSRYSVSEIAKKDAEAQNKIELFKAVRSAITLRNISKNETQTYTLYDKELLRTYMKNPTNYENRLRNLSQFLYRMSYEYRRVVQYFASMTDLSAMIAVPQTSMVKNNNANKILRDYEKVLNENKKMNMKNQILKMLTIAWREDACYGYTYEDDTGFFILPLDGDYCKISSQNYDGTYNFAFDFSYFRNHMWLLDYWDKRFSKMYDAYLKDSNLRWQQLPPERTFCLKVNQDNPLLCLPPFVALFENIIDLIDLQSIQSVKNSLSAYKLLVMEAETLDKATEPDQFKVDLDTAIEYYNKMAEDLPDEVSSCLSLLPIKSIDFKGTTSEDTDMVAGSMSNLFKASGVTLLDRNKLEGTTAFTTAMIADSESANAVILPQIEAWVNRYIKYALGTVNTQIKYLHVSPYTKQNYLTTVLTAAQYGAPVKLQVAALLGLDPMESYSMEFLENEVLALHNKWIPLSSSFTSSGASNADATRNQGGRPTGSGTAKAVNEPQDSAGGEG